MVSCCLVCREAEESVQHVFSECPFTRQILQELNVSFSSSNREDSWKIWLAKEFIHRNQDTCKSWVISFWALWHNCNNIYHEEVHQNVYERTGIGDVMKANFDATFYQGTKSATAGILVRNNEGFVMAACTYPFEHVADSTAAEAKVNEASHLLVEEGRRLALPRFWVEEVPREVEAEINNKVDLRNLITDALGINIPTLNESFDEVSSEFQNNEKSLTCLLEFLNEAFPNGNIILTTYYKAKKKISALNLGYVMIDACSNDCMLYWGDASKNVSCDVCKSSRWQSSDELDADEQVDGSYHGPKPAKDAFDRRFPNFAFDPRHVRLGLASDGFNPFQKMSTSHSTWPILLIPYNLDLWACMKQSLMILSMVIPGEKGPDNDIDVCLLWTINEFPACNATLPETVAGFEHESREFDGTIECGVAPIPRFGKDILREVEDFFKRLYAKSLDSQEVDQLQIQVAKLGGPVQYMWIYQIKRNDGNIQKWYIFSSEGRPIGTMNTTILDMEFLESYRAAYDGIQISKRTEDKWLIPKVEAEQVDADVIGLAQGPYKVVSTYDGFIVNGFRVHTKKHEQHHKTQNSGVMVFADGRNYYGNCTEIIELNYYERFGAIMLRCDWVNIKSPRSMKKDANGFIMVKFSKLIHIGSRDSNDPYILASQAKQVFYVKDGKSER
ncbi:hypothetical protein CXB51_014456 [Gossypium anomalum]|uniref:Reverse transcriptase zinc-binding domain-containing protein n=1 Tax=Gossypium anomalum TaxID=47600 RepID=A0A8J5Z476_9ROSI|nr:hypothetical protein CXB51_014456 [Gossypium anomalum]